MKAFQKRATALELMDLGADHYTKNEYVECLEMLAKIGKWLRGNKISLNAIKAHQPDSILDVGCGGGDFAYLLAKRFPRSKVVGIDIDSGAIERASTHFSLPNLSFKKTDLNKIPVNSYDVVSATLVCHHLDNQQLVPFIQRAQAIAKKKFIINDLHRSPLAYFLFACISRSFFRNRLILHDGLLSIQKGFKRQDWKELISQTNIDLKKVQIRWKWPFRWCVEIG